MVRRELDPGATGTATLHVSPSDTAKGLSAEHAPLFPDVLATARLIAWLELAAGRALQPILGPGEQSVGVLVDVRHSAPTPVGATVRATARFLGLSGKFYRFEVWAEDDAGEIARGTHERAIIDAGRLAAGAEKRRR
jgi:fluoroacetyl-CoA thioesterase